jgi:hypothetical protein
LAAALLLLGAMTVPLIVGRVDVLDDLGNFHLPLRGFYAQQLARGEPFDWMPQLYCGFYLTGEGQAGTYHPLHLLLYRWLPLPAAFELELWASYALMLPGTYWFLRRLGIRREAAIFGSLAFTFSGFNLLHFVHPNAIAVMAHLLWLLVGIDVLLTSADPRHRTWAAAGIALATGSQILIGYPQYVWFTLLAEVAFIVLRAGRFISAHPASLGGRGEMLARRLLLWTTAKGMGLMLGAVQLLPTIDALSHSARRAPSAAFTNAGSLHPVNLVQLVAPYLFAERVLPGNTHEYGLYIGSVPLLLIVWLRCHPDRLGRLRPLALAMALLGGISLWMAMGPSGQIYRLQQWLPLVGGFRCPCRYLGLCHLATSVLAAIGLVLLMRQCRRNRPVPWRKLSPLGIVVLLSLSAAVVGIVLHGRPSFAPLPAVLLGPVLVGAAALLVALAARGSRQALVALVLLAALDLGSYGLSYAVYAHTARLEGYIAATLVPPGPVDGRVVGDLLRFDDLGPRIGNQLLLAGWSRADGYAGLEPQRRLDPRQLPTLRAAGVRWVRRSATSTAIDGLRDPDPDSPWLEVPAPLALVRLVTQVRASDDPARDIARVALETTALVDHPVALDGGPPGRLSIALRRPGRWEIDTDCAGRQMLVVAESFHSGWQATIDAHRVPVLPVNGDFLGCVVGPGRQHLVLEFRPRSLAAGWVVTCLGLGLLIALVLPTLRLRPRVQ